VPKARCGGPRKIGWRPVRHLTKRRARVGSDSIRTDSSFLF
jgi:hypothetical protein